MTKKYTLTWKGFSGEINHHDFNSRKEADKVRRRLGRVFIPLTIKDI